MLLLETNAGDVHCVRQVDARGPLADFETWLSGSAEDAFKLARSYAAEQMHIVQFGTEREDLLTA